MARTVAKPAEPGEILRQQTQPVGWRTTLAAVLPLLVVLSLGLALRLIVWRWREFYPLGGDEQEYLAKALILLRERRYEELELMRPPLYTLFLAGSIYLFDSLIQRLRLIQALISAATVALTYLLTREILLLTGAATKPQRPGNGSGPALMAASLAALSYTLAATATELLSETVFLAGLTLFFWLLLRAGRSQGAGWAAIAGLSLGLLALTRSVALPLLPLGVLWLLGSVGLARVTGASRWMSLLKLPLVFGLCCCLLIGPWTLRNYLTYGAPILIDTTGAENLWLDNDPAGRAAVKAQLLALGEDRAARQALALEQGRKAILAAPQAFLAKAWRELQHFFALQYFDELRAEPAIWVPPLEIGARVLLGDGIWLLLLGAGVGGLWLYPAATKTRQIVPVQPGQHSPTGAPALAARQRGSKMQGFALDPRWLLVPWALYVLLSGLLFHVELRYRLPLYPVLLPYAGWALIEGRRQLRSCRRPSGRAVLAAISLLLIAALMLAHQPYLRMTAMLARKHLLLWRAERALARGAEQAAVADGSAALALDPGSALARVVLARAALARSDSLTAEELLRQAINVLPTHPHPHLLLGGLLRDQGRLSEARTELGYETASLQDLQLWALKTLPQVAAPRRIDVGDLDLGYLQGFYPCALPRCPIPRLPEQARWSKARAELRLTRPAAGKLRLRIAAPRPAGAPPARLDLLLDGQPLATLQPRPEWQTIELPLPSGTAGTATLTLLSTTFRPRDNDPASPDGRRLGLQVDWVETTSDE